MKYIIVRGAVGDNTVGDAGSDEMKQIVWWKMWYWQVCARELTIISIVININ